MTPLDASDPTDNGRCLTTSSTVTLPLAGMIGMADGATLKSCVLPFGEVKGTAAAHCCHSAHQHRLSPSVSHRSCDQVRTVLEPAAWYGSF